MNHRVASRRVSQSSALAAFGVQRRKVEPPVTYTEGIPDKNTLRIHSVYVQGVLHKRLGRGEVRIQQPARPAGSKETPMVSEELTQSSREKSCHLPRRGVHG